MAPLVKRSDSRLPMTPAQKRVLRFVRRYIDAHDRAPSHREIAEGCGFASHRGAAGHVERLCKKGYLRKTAGLRRGLEVVE